MATDSENANRSEAAIIVYGVLPFYASIFPKDRIVAKAASLCLALTKEPDDDLRIDVIRALRKRQERIVNLGDNYYRPAEINLAISCLDVAVASLNVHSNTALLGARRYFNEAKGYAGAIEQDGRHLIATGVDAVVVASQKPDGGEVVPAMRPDSF